MCKVEILRWDRERREERQEEEKERGTQRKKRM